MTAQQKAIVIAKHNLEYWKRRGDLLKLPGNGYFDNVGRCEDILRKLEAGWRWNRQRDYMPTLQPPKLEANQ
jgi:hypothetical protein